MSIRPLRNGRQYTFLGNEDKFDVRPYLKPETGVSPDFVTGKGALFATDCMAVLPRIANEVINAVFADPPFNLGKEYGANTDDEQPDARGRFRTSETHLSVRASSCEVALARTGRRRRSSDHH